jgi:hypothetical protein
VRSLRAARAGRALAEGSRRLLHPASPSRRLRRRRGPTLRRIRGRGRLGGGPGRRAPGRCPSRWIPARARPRASRGLPGLRARSAGGRAAGRARRRGRLRRGDRRRPGCAGRTPRRAYRAPLRGAPGPRRWLERAATAAGLRTRPRGGHGPERRRPATARGRTCRRRPGGQRLRGPPHVALERRPRGRRDARDRGAEPRRVRRPHGERGARRSRPPRAPSRGAIVLGARRRQGGRGGRGEGAGAAGRGHAAGRDRHRGAQRASLYGPRAPGARAARGARNGPPQAPARTDPGSARGPVAVRRRRGGVDPARTRRAGRAALHRRGPGRGGREPHRIPTPRHRVGCVGRGASSSAGRGGASRARIRGG